MELLTRFTTYLLSHHASKATFINYQSDIRKLVAWYEDTYGKPFNPIDVSANDIQESKIYYKKSLSPSSLKRYQASINKFFEFLFSEKIIPVSPLLRKDDAIKGFSLNLKKFNSFLAEGNTTPVTRINYLSDIKSFLLWSGIDLHSNMVNFSTLSPSSLENYIDYLQKKGLKLNSITRKRISINRYLKWLIDTKCINEDVYIEEIPSENKDFNNLVRNSLSLEEIKESSNQVTYSKFPPVRLAQRLIILFQLVERATIKDNFVNFKNKIRLIFWNIKGVPLFLFNKKTNKKDHDVPNIYKKISTWYNQYNKTQLFQHFHFSILIIGMSLIGFALYQNFWLQSPSDANLYGTAPFDTTQSIPFKGKLLDRFNNPITTQKKIAFSLYSNSTSSYPLLWQEISSITPDKRGYFSVNLGRIKPIPQAVFKNNSNIYLGISIEGQKELFPRQKIPNTNFANEARSIEGLTPITTSSESKNVLLALDSSGNLSLGGNSDHSFEASGGEFKLSGKSLLLATSLGSNSDIIFNPDGVGKINILKPIQNTSNDGNLSGIPGAVEIDDTLSILSNSSSQSALHINQLSSGYLINASASGTKEFSLDTQGNGFFRGILSIGNLLGTPSASFDAGSIYYDIEKHSLMLNNGIGWNQISNGENIWEKNGSTISLPFDKTKKSNFSFLDINNVPIASLSASENRGISFSADGIIQTSANQNLSIGGQTTGNILFNPLQGYGRIGINTSEPNATLTVTSKDDDTILTSIKGKTKKTALAIDNESGDLLTASAAGKARFLISQEGNVVIGSNTTLNTNAKDGYLYLPSSNGIQTSTPTQYTGSLATEYDATNNKLCIYNNGWKCTSTGTFNDYAEWAPAPNTESADVVSISKVKNSINDPTAPYVLEKAQSSYDNKVVGVISTYAEQENSANGYKRSSDYHAIALTGRVPIKVSTMNGTIEPGDLLTSSPIPGVAMKARTSGFTIGTALDYASDANPHHSNQILAFIQPTYNVIQIAKDVTIHKDDTSGYAIYDDTHTLIENISNFSQSVIAKIYAGAIVTKELSTDTLAINTEAISIAGKSLHDYIQENVIDEIKKPILTPISLSEKVYTNIVSPLSPEESLSLSFKDNAIRIKNSKDDSGRTVASIDNTGNATFSGTLASNQITVSQDATIAGVLRARKIIADDIVSNSMSTSTLSSQYITNVTNIYTNTSSSNYNPDNAKLPLDENNTDIASFSSFLSYIPELHAKLGLFQNGLTSLGTTSLGSTAIQDGLVVDQKLRLADNAVNVLGGDIELQSLKQGGISIASGLIYIDNKGNITVNGDGIFKNNLFANKILPLEGANLSIQLGNNASSSANQELNVQNASGSGILSVNQIGDIIASGAATFKKINLQGTALAVPLSETEISSTSSAGLSIIKTGQREITIKNPLVTKDSLIYITPVGTPSAQIPFLLRQIPQESFTVGVQNIDREEIKFNWLIIN